ncbi:MAG: hypothetical protein ACOC88_01530 [Candidatus Bipolaricaulota bacterium]
MHNKRFYVVSLLVGLILLSGVLVLASDEMSDKLTRVVKHQLGLESDTFEVIETEYQGDTLILIAIYGPERAQDSSLGEDIKDALMEYKDQHPVAISVLSQNKNTKFQPYAIRVSQNGEKLSVKNVVGLTEGFDSGKMPEEIPIEGKTFWGSKGVVTLGEDFSPSESFSVQYGTRSASFSGTGESQQVSSPPTPSSDSSESVNPSTEPNPDTSSESVNPSTEPNPDTSSSGSSDDLPATGSSKAGQGMTLLGLGGALLLMTLSLL